MNLLLKLGLVIFLGLSIHESEASIGPEKLSSVADQIVQSYQELGWFSGTVLMAKDGNVFYTKSIGFQDDYTKIENSVKTLYNIGSIVKNFTSVLVLQQVESGTIELSDTIGKFSLGFSDTRASKITIEQLMHHRSGLPDIFNAAYRENAMAFDTVSKRLSLLLDTKLLFEPGSNKRYSNYGYVVLGAILEKITGKRFDTLLQERIFAPTKMSNSSFRVNKNNQFQSSRYSYRYDNSLKKVGVTEQPGPDGGIESSVNDVHRFYRALFYSNVLLDRNRNENRTFFNMEGSSWRAYGGGVGVSAAVEIDLENNIEVIVLSNSDNLVAELISQRMIAFIQTGEYAKAKPLSSNFAYQHYISQKPNKSFNFLKEEYQNAGYNQFIGRTLNTLGMQLLEDKKWEEAFDTFLYLQSLFPKAPQVFDSLAFAYFKQGNFNEAKSTFAKAKLIKPDFNSDYNSDNYQ